jgi:predicted DNA-binding transcriptional regulator YafY
MIMRADRLLSLIMILQTRGRVTAGELARELEVTERTIYRDVLALSSAGIPVYTERGPGGGVGLVESYRTSLTGLSEEEAQALFMLSIPAPLVELGVGKELKAAMLKLAAALPASRRDNEAHTRQRIYLDSVPWFQADEPVPHLQVLQQAAWQDRRLDITYRSNFGSLVRKRVDPYGLVAKASSWYLVYAGDGNPRVVKVARVVEATLLDEYFERPIDFNLETFWWEWCIYFEKNRPFVEVKVRIAPSLVPYMPGYFSDTSGNRIVQTDTPDPDGWLRMTITFENYETARTRILGLGRAIEVLEPETLRLGVIDFAEQIVKFYAREE